MKQHTRTLLAGLALLPLVLANDGLAERLGYEPKAGSSLVKRVEIESELELDEMTFEMNGQDMSGMSDAIDMALKTTMKLSVTDSYESIAIAGGRPEKLKRSFDVISSTTHVSGSNPATGEQELEIPAASDLEGTTVVFSWNESGESYDVAFAEGEGDEELLEDLWENLDLRGFLPDKEVGAEESWKIPADAVKALLAPGGDLKLRPQGDIQGGSGMEQFSPNDIVGSLEGEFQAVFSGVREEGDVRVGVIKLEIDAQSAQDLSDKNEMILEQMSENLPPGMEARISAFDGEFQFDSEGELLWNIEAGLPHSLSLSGEMRMTLDISMTIVTGEGEQAMEQSMTFAGAQTIAFTTGD